MWTTHSDFMDVVKKVWLVPMPSNPVKILMAKLKIVIKKEARVWN